MDQVLSNNPFRLQQSAHILILQECFIKKSLALCWLSYVLRTVNLEGKLDGICLYTCTGQGVSPVKTSAS